MVMLFLMTAFLYMTLACTDTTTPANKKIPEPNLVSFNSIPRPFSDNIYFFYGLRLDDGPEALLKKLLENNLEIKKAWYPYKGSPGECSMAIVQQLIVMTALPDNRMYDLGFTSDSTQASVNICIPIWEEYRFNY